MSRLHANSGRIADPTPLSEHEDPSVENEQLMITDLS